MGRTDGEHELEGQEHFDEEAAGNRGVVAERRCDTEWLYTASANASGKDDGLILPQGTAPTRQPRSQWLQLAERGTQSARGRGTMRR